MQSGAIEEKLNTGALATVGLVGVLCAAAVLSWIEMHNQTIFQDEWTFFVAREHLPFTDALFIPDNGHLIAVPVLLYMGLAEVFGMDSWTPWIVTEIGLNLLCCTLLFLVLRPLLGGWPAVGLAALFLVFGAGYEIVATTLGINGLFFTACALGMFLALRREDLRGDLLASLLLLLAFGCSSVALGFAASAAVLVSSRGAPDRVRRSWVWAIPLAVYVGWALWSLHYDTSNVAIAGAERHVAPSSIPALPAYFVESAAAVMASLTGLFREAAAGVNFDSTPGLPVALVALGLLVLRLRRGRVPPLAQAALLYLIVLWAATGVSYVPGREPDAPRYLYLGAIGVVLAAAALVGSPPRLSLKAWTLAGAVLGLAMVANLFQFHYTARALDTLGERERGEVSAVEIVRDTVAPDFQAEDVEGQVLLGGLNTFFLPASTYLHAADRFGSLGYEERELIAAPQPARKAADITLTRALGMALQPGAARIDPSASPPKVEGLVGGRLRTRANCIRVRPTAASATLGLSLARRLEIQAGAASRVEVMVGRFADGYQRDLGTVQPGPSAAAVLAIPRDRASVPWRAQLLATGPFTACG